MLVFQLIFVCGPDLKGTCRLRKIYLSPNVKGIGEKLVSFGLSEW